MHVRNFSAISIVMCLIFFSQAILAESMEQKIKAAYIYNFTKFVTWPEHQSETFNLCILGNDPFGPLINGIESRTALGLPIRLVRLRKFDPKKPVYCHILFVGVNAKKDILNLFSSTGILTVSEKNNFARRGGMIGFVVKRGKVKLQINLNQFKQSGLKVSAKLLEVAEIIEGNGDG